MGPPGRGRAMQKAQARRMMLLYAGVVLGAVWVIVALLAQYNPGFFLYGAFQDLGFLFEQARQAAHLDEPAARQLVARRRAADA